MGICTWRLWHQWISGPLMTVAALAVLIGIAHYGLPIPPPAPIYLTAVVCSAVVGGMGAGLISAALTLIHTVWLFSTPGALLHDTYDNALHLSMLAAAAPGLAIIVGLLKRHAGRARQAATREERKFRSVTQVEEALRASEARFRHLIRLHSGGDHPSTLETPLCEPGICRDVRIYSGRNPGLGLDRAIVCAPGARTAPSLSRGPPAR